MATNIDDLGNAIERELTLYSQEVTENIKDETKRAIKELVQKTKDNAPVGNRSKHYKDNIKQRTVTNTSTNLTKMWYVEAPDYRLSHLLENGHATRNGGRVQGTHFISNAESEVVPEYEKRVEEAIKNGK